MAPRATTRQRWPRRSGRRVRQYHTRSKISTGGWPPGGLASGHKAAIGFLSALPAHRRNRPRGKSTRAQLDSEAVTAPREMVTKAENGVIKPPAHGKGDIILRMGRAMRIAVIAAGLVVAPLVLAGIVTAGLACSFGCVAWLACADAARSLRRR